MTDDTPQVQGSEAPPDVAVNAIDPTNPPSPKPKKVFSRAAIKRYISVAVHLPNLYPDYEPWKFKLRLKLSQDAEERRQEYISLSQSEQAVKEFEQNLDELCDLLVDMPQGFSDLQDTGTGPGESFKSYVMSATGADRDFLLLIVRGAITSYWRKLSPQEFRK